MLRPRCHIIPIKTGTLSVWFIVLEPDHLKTSLKWPLIVFLWTGQSADELFQRPSVHASVLCFAFTSSSDAFGFKLRETAFAELHATRDTWSASLQLSSFPPPALISPPLSSSPSPSILSRIHIRLHRAARNQRHVERLQLLANHSPNPSPLLLFLPLSPLLVFLPLFSQTLFSTLSLSIFFLFLSFRVLSFGLPTLVAAAVNGDSTSSPFICFLLLPFFSHLSRIPFLLPTPRHPPFNPLVLLSNLGLLPLPLFSSGAVTQSVLFFTLWHHLLANCCNYIVQFAPAGEPGIYDSVKEKRLTILFLLVESCC